MRKQLSKSDIENLNKEIFEQFGIPEFFGKKENVMLIDESHMLLVVKDKMVYFFYKDGKLVPTLRLLMEKPILKQVVVDMGAVKFMSSGADVMRPGIVELDHEIRKDDLVVVVDQTHKKPLCVAQSFFSGEEIANMQRGKVLKSLHWVGDAVWNFAP